MGTVNTGKVSFTFTASCAECENSVVSRRDKSIKSFCMFVEEFDIMKDIS